ncbi:MAG: hypothetical protein SFW35_04135 [Chitinophagales bacterium]|nr:hypothetical protein [Chitinophagales bacterium]
MELFLLVGLLCLFSCNRNGTAEDHRDMPNVAHTLKVERDSLGNVVSEIWYVNDSIKDSLAKYYYPSGTLYRETNFKDGKKHGTCTEYYPSGVLKQKFEARSGFMYGPISMYYPSGKLEMEGQTVLSLLHGPVKFFSEEGKLLALRVFSGDEPFYTIRYDAVGNIKSEEGSVLISASQIVVEKNEKLTFSAATVAVLPDRKTTVRLGLKGKNLKEVPIRDYRVQYTNKFKKSGEYTLVVEGTIADTTGRIIKKDTVEVKLLVLDE